MKEGSPFRVAKNFTNRNRSETATQFTKIKVLESEIKLPPKLPQQKKKPKRAFKGVSFVPMHYVDVETGDTFLVTSIDEEQKLDKKRFHKVNVDLEKG